MKVSSKFCLIPEAISRELVVKARSRTWLLVRKISLKSQGCPETGDGWKRRRRRQMGRVLGCIRSDRGESLLRARLVALRPKAAKRWNGLSRGDI